VPSGTPNVKVARVGDTVDVHDLCSDDELAAAPRKGSPPKLPPRDDPVLIPSAPSNPARGESPVPAHNEAPSDSDSPSISVKHLATRNVFHGSSVAVKVCNAAFGG
jgi:hypothetical protein